MKFKVVLLICVLLAFSFVGCNNSKAANKTADETKITSLKVRNIKAEAKEIKDKSEIEKVLALVDSVKILKSDVELPIGIGYGVDITYSNGNKVTLSFLNSTMLRNGTCYEIDKNIVDELRNIYDRN